MEQLQSTQTTVDSSLQVDLNPKLALERAAQREGWPSPEDEESTTPRWRVQSERSGTGESRTSESAVAGARAAEQSNRQAVP